MRFSIIGCQHAHIGIFINDMLSLGHTCAGIYETDNIKLAKSLSTKFKIPIVNNWMELLDESIDVVGCASINNEKMDVIEQCEKYGKNIMIDKPAVTNRRDFERLAGVISRGKIQVGVLLTERFRPSLAEIKRQISQGNLGEIVSICMRKPHLLNAANRPSWHFSKKQSGGIIVDLLVHDFDLIRWLTNQEIKSVSAYMAKNILPDFPTFYDVAGAQVVMEKGVTAQLYADWHTPEKSWTWGDGRIFVVGTKGVIEYRLEGDPVLSRDSIGFKVTDKVKLTEIPENMNTQTITQDFLNRLAGKPGIVTHEDILKATKAALDADENATVINRFSR